MPAEDSASVSMEVLLEVPEALGVLVWKLGVLVWKEGSLKLSVE